MAFHFINPFMIVPAALQWSFVGYCESTGTSLNFGSLSAGAIAANDLLVYIDFALNATTTVSPVTPSGFTNNISTIGNFASDELHAMVSHKKAAGSEGVITGMSEDSHDKMGLVFRPTIAPSTIVGSAPTSTMSETNPSARTVDPSAETIAVVLIGIAGIESGTSAFSSASPAFDAEIVSTNSDLRVGYKIYNSGPASHTFDMNDLGNYNWLAGLYYEYT